MCERIAQAGADIIAVSAVQEHVDDTVERAQAFGVRASAQVADVSDFDALRTAIDNGAQALAAPDLLVNVVGGVTPQYWHRLSDYPIETFDHLLTTNLRYAFVSAQHVARRLIDDGRGGAIVNISSIASAGQPLLGAYGAAKAGLATRSPAPWRWSGGAGIRVTAWHRHRQHAAVGPRSDDGRAMPRRSPCSAAGARRHRRRRPLPAQRPLAGYVTVRPLAVDARPDRAGIDRHDLPRAVTNPAIRARFEQ